MRTALTIIAAVLAMTCNAQTAKSETKYTFNTDEGTIEFTVFGNDMTILSANVTKAWKSFSYRYTSTGKTTCSAFTKDTTNATAELQVLMDHSKAIVSVAIRTPSSIPNDHVTLQIGAQSFYLPTGHLFGDDPDSAAVTSKTYPEKTRQIIDAIRRGHQARLTYTSQTGYDITVPFSLMGATAMTNDAASNCGMLALVQPRRRAQPTRQARTTTQPRQHQTQTATHQPREEDPLYDFAGDIADQGLQMVVDEITNQMFGDFGF